MELIGINVTGRKKALIHLSETLLIFSVLNQGGRVVEKGFASSQSYSFSAFSVSFEGCVLSGACVTSLQ